jgi:PD-(D/E)XK endonuclease
MANQSGDPTAALIIKDAEGLKEPRNSKRTGELSEAAFLHKAVSLGLKVTKPWGDSERYDFVVDAGRRLWRVQIKCTAAIRAGGYHIQPIHFVYGKSKVVYTAEDIDVLAAHIVPLDVWYVVPVQALAQGRSLRLYPDGGCERARFEKYREGWDFFRGGEAADVTPAEAEDEQDEEPVEERVMQWIIRRPIIRCPVWKPPTLRVR